MSQKEKYKGMPSRKLKQKFILKDWESLFLLEAVSDVETRATYPNLLVVLCSFQKDKNVKKRLGILVVKQLLNKEQRGNFHFFFFFAFLVSNFRSLSFIHLLFLLPFYSFFLFSFILPFSGFFFSFVFLFVSFFLDL